VLRGHAGHTALLQDAKGARFDSPSVDADDARPGSTVVLTVNQTLQDIAEKALGDALHKTGATGGDIVMLDPNSGEVRAMASRRADPLSTSATALTEPYEPGSTLKPLVAARLLDLHRARVDEVMNTYNGKWELNGRKIEDDHPAPSFSLADVIRFSSNIGIVQFAMRFSPREQYELLRDVGFGTPSGLPYPAEESGRLPTPQRWDKQTPASLAMGYALNVTPLQLANAYGAIANGGELLQPAIVKEIRATDGTVLYRHERTVVRRVMTDETARTVRGLLRGVVEGGTGDSASLATFDVAGKTGTAKRTEHGKYVAGKYTASFVGLFPADAPQLVILVKLDNPSSSIYGGKAAAPVLKTVLQAAIAARDASLDRRNLAAVPKRVNATAALPESVASADSIVRVTESGSVPYVYRLDSPRKPPAAAIAARAVPDVSGFPVRRAVYALHRAGFRVSLATMEASGAAGSTLPPAGTLAPSGTTVRLLRAP
jgi:cell division protein FtsI (penicillin-binding protein 3)